MKHNKVNSISPDNNVKREELIKRANQIGIKYIDLRYDFAFKTIFGTPGNEDLLLMLLDAILPEKHILSVELGPQEQQGDSYESKRVIYDIRCKTEYGPMTIEMQFGEREEFSHRMVYYASRAVSNCVKKGTDDYTLPEIYVIGIANYILPEVTSNENIINKYALINKEDGKTLLNNTLNFVTVELPKFIKDEENLTSWTDIMIFLIKNMGLLKSRPEKLADKNLDKLFERSMFANMETEAQRRYLDEMMWEIDQRARWKYARKKAIAEGHAEGHAEGLAKGFAEGEAKGRAEGEAKGRAEEREKNAKSMKLNGIETSLISKITGLAPHQIEAL